MNIGHASKGLVKSPHQIGLMREAGRIAAIAVEKALEALEHGVTTAEIDRIAHDEIVHLGAKPAFLGQYDFPATACISINDEIVHGIPSERQLKNGDLVSIDCGAIVDGFYSDMARTAIVGGPSTNSKDAENLVQHTRTALKHGIEQVRPGNRVGDIAHAIESFGNKHSYGIVREYTGHGIGAALHEPPQVPNFGTPDTGEVLRIGMVLAIEPMFMLGSWETTVLEDNWTVVTRDGSLSAHFEDTVLVGENGAEVLTA